MNMQRTSLLSRIVPGAEGATAPSVTEPALNIATVYQDPLTRQWATELWERVGQLVSDEVVWHQSWKISDLMDSRVFTDSVRAASEADVLVVSVRDAGELPIGLYAWIDAWMPSRAGRAGALVALIGVPPEPSAQAGRAHGYLEAVARKAGLDFLPRERKLPEEPFAPSGPERIGQAVSRAIPLAAGAFSSGPRAHWHGGLNE
jgi:hypothetical protein